MSNQIPERRKTITGIAGLFVIAGAVVWGVGQKYINVTAKEDWQHDTEVVGLAHVVFLACASFCFLFGLIWFLYPRIFKRQMNTTWGYIHLGITSGCLLIAMWPQHYAGIASSPHRQYSDKGSPGANTLQAFLDVMSPVAAAAVAVLLVAQAIFVVNFVGSLFHSGRGVD